MSMQSYTQINPLKKPYDAKVAANSLRAKPAPSTPWAYANQHYSDLYTPAAQQASMELRRADTQAQQQYFNRAADAQNQSALAGLGLVADQESNAMQRGQAAQRLTYNWMKDLFSNSNRVLGGLL